MSCSVDHHVGLSGCEYFGRCLYTFAPLSQQNVVSTLATGGDADMKKLGRTVYSCSTKIQVEF